MPSILTAAVGVFYLAAAIVSASRKAATVDESAHIGAGVSYWETGDFRLNPEHPPLVKALAGGLAILATHPHFEVVNPEKNEVLSLWSEGDQFRFGNYFLYHQNDADRILFWARMVPILFGLLGGWAAWWWGRELGGPWAGFCAAAFLLLYPEYMGHARWVTFDVPVAAVCGVCSVALWRWWRRPGFGRAVAFVGAAVAASLVKLTAGVFLALLGFGVLVAALARWRWRIRPFSDLTPWSRDASAKGKRTGSADADAPARTLSAAIPTPLRRSFAHRRGALPLLALFGASLLAVYGAIWAAAGFRFSLTAPGEPHLTVPEAYLAYASQKTGNSAGKDIGLFRLTRPLYDHRLLPETYLAVLNTAGAFKGRLSFLMGKTSRDGFLTYFFWTILLKTPLLYLALGGVALVEGLRGLFRVPADGFSGFRRARYRYATAFIAFPFLFLFLVSVLSRVNLGHRYILFFYLPWSVGMGVVTARLIARRKGRWGRWIGIAILLWALVVNLRAFPNYATYFNSIGGGPLHASNYLLDSNVGWGQDLKAAGEYVKNHHLGEVNLAYFGPADPSYYGIAKFRQILPSYPFAINLPNYKPMDPRLYSFVSLNNLQSVRALYPGYFRGKPQAVLNSILVFPPQTQESHGGKIQ